MYMEWHSASLMWAGSQPQLPLVLFMAELLVACCAAQPCITQIVNVQLDACSFGCQDTLLLEVYSMLNI